MHTMLVIIQRRFFSTFYSTNNNSKKNRDNGKTWLKKKVLKQIRFVKKRFNPG